MLPPVFRQAALDRLEETARSYFEEVVKQDLEGDVPINLEFKKRVPFPGLEGLLISGKMDRIDQRKEQFRIYDYKSGKAPEKSDLKREVFLGLSEHLAQAADSAQANRRSPAALRSKGAESGCPATFLTIVPAPGSAASRLSPGGTGQTGGDCQELF